MLYQCGTTTTECQTFCQALPSRHVSVRLTERRPDTRVDPDHLEVQQLLTSTLSSAHLYSSQSCLPLSILHRLDTFQSQFSTNTLSSTRQYLACLLSLDLRVIRVEKSGSRSYKKVDVLHACSICTLVTAHYNELYWRRHNCNVESKHTGHGILLYAR